MPSSDKKKWDAQAQEIDDAEFTALLGEEWEKLSADKQKKATIDARDDINRRDQEQRELEIKKQDLAAKKKKAATEKNEARGGANNADADADNAVPLKQTTTATAAATADRQVWLRNKKFLAYKVLEAQKDPEGPLNKIAVIPGDIVRGIVKSLNSTSQSEKQGSRAFKCKVRVACRCIVSGGPCLLPLITIRAWNLRL